MNKTKKLLVLMLALLMMCLCLTGCDELDDMREHHATWVDDKSTDSFVLNGVTYVYLEDAYDLDPMYNTGYESEIIFVTEKDVPVLLSETNGQLLDLSADKNFVSGYIYENYDYNESVTGYWEEPGGHHRIYCKEELYDELKQNIIDGIKFTNYGYSYWEYIGEDENDEYRYMYLDDEQSKVISTVLDTVKPESDDAMYDQSIYLLELDRISEDKMFARGSYELLTDGLGNYSLAIYSYATEGYTLYVVPEKYNEVFDDISFNAKANGVDLYTEY